MALEGSTATMLYPSRASHAASRPVPAPTSSTSAGAGGSMSISHSCNCIGSTASYDWASMRAFVSYQAEDSVGAVIPRAAYHWPGVRRGLPSGSCRSRTTASPLREWVGDLLGSTRGRGGVWKVLLRLKMLYRFVQQGL